MKKMLVVLLAGSVFILNGCVAVVGNTGGERKCSGSEIKTQHTSAMADVDFVSNLSPQAKVDGYKAIAQRAYLTRAERAYLVEAVKKDVLDQKQKDEILLALLHNPTVGSGGPRVKKDRPRRNK
jgi:protein involved in sex pheromone biosynthesis